MEQALGFSDEPMAERKIGIKRFKSCDGSFDCIKLSVV